MTTVCTAAAGPARLRLYWSGKGDYSASLLSLELGISSSLGNAAAVIGSTGFIFCLDFISNLSRAALACK